VNKHFIQGFSDELEKRAGLGGLLASITPIGQAAGLIRKIKTPRQKLVKVSSIGSVGRRLTAAKNLSSHFVKRPALASTSVRTSKDGSTAIFRPPNFKSSAGLKASATRSQDRTLSGDGINPKAPPA
tara:strand:- start:2179 stop:2559 length:381 start_codon:yes stop_codon:yes gene_type:complete